MASESVLKFQRANIKQVKFALNKNTEPELIEWIEKKENIRQYLIGLIKEDMKKAANDSR